MKRQQLARAGKELLKLNFGNAVKSLSFPVAPDTYSRGNGFYLFGADGSEKFFETGSGNKSLKAYDMCPPVAAILGQKAQAFINGETFVMRAGGKGKDKEATSEQANKIANLLKNPNPEQSGAHFEAQVYINTMLFGYTIILPVKPFGFPNYEATQLWVIPGNMIEVEESDTLFYENGAKIIKNIWLTYKNKRTPLPPDEVIVIKDFGPSFRSVGFPDSRLIPLMGPICNITGAMESRGVLITNRGPKYVVSSGMTDASGKIAMMPTEKKEAENAFKHYGLLREQSQAIITSAALNITPIGYDIKQLGLIEEVQESSSMICIGLGFPKFLAGLSDPTFNNQEAAEKSLYQRFIIPEAKSIYGQLNKWFGTASLNIIIVKDFSELPVLQDDRKSMAQALLTSNQALIIEWKAGMITANEWRVANNRDTVIGWDIYYDEWVRLGYAAGEVPAMTQNQNQDQNAGNANQ